MRVSTYRTALEVTGRAASATPFEAKFSLPFLVASALVHGSIRLDGFGPEFEATLGRSIAGREPGMIVVRASLKPPPTTSPRWYRKR